MHRAGREVFDTPPLEDVAAVLEAVLVGAPLLRLAQRVGGGGDAAALGAVARLRRRGEPLAGGEQPVGGREVGVERRPVLARRLRAQRLQSLAPPARLCQRVL